MKELLVMRHAKAEQDAPGGDDHARQLASRGERNAAAMGKCLRLAEIVPDRIVSSTAARAVRSAELVAEACGYRGRIDSVDAVYGASAETLLGLLGALQDPLQRVLLVGHNPGLENLIWQLTAPAPQLAASTGLRLATGAMVLMELALDRWGDIGAGRGQLEWLLPPRLAMAIQPKL